MKNQDISSPVSVIGIFSQIYRLNHQPNIAEILLKVALNTINLNQQNKHSYDIVWHSCRHVSSSTRYLHTRTKFYSADCYSGTKQGRIQDFKIGGGALKKFAPGGTKIVGVFRVKNHDFTPKNQFFFQL